MGARLCKLRGEYSDVGFWNKNSQIPLICRLLNIWWLGRSGVSNLINVGVGTGNSKVISIGDGEKIVRLGESGNKKVQYGRGYIICMCPEETLHRDSLGFYSQHIITCANTRQHVQQKYTQWHGNIPTDPVFWNMTIARAKQLLLLPDKIAYLSYIGKEGEREKLYRQLTFRPFK